MENPEFYQGIKRVAEQNGMEYIKAFRISADQMSTLQAKDPQMWRNFVPGLLLWLDDCGLKMDGANNIAGVIETMNNGGEHIHSRLAMVEKIIDSQMKICNCSTTPPNCQKAAPMAATAAKTRSPPLPLVS